MRNLLFFLFGLLISFSKAHAYQVYIRSDQEDVRPYSLFVELLNDEEALLLSHKFTFPLNGVEINRSLVPDIYTPQGTFRVTLLREGHPVNTSVIKMRKIKKVPYGDLYIYVTKDNSLMVNQDQNPWK